MQIITDRAHNGLMTAMLGLELLLLLVMVLLVLVVVSVLWCRWLALWIRHARTPPSSGLRLSVVCAACCLLPVPGSAAASSATRPRLVAALLLSLKYFRFCSDFACAYGTLACSRIAFHFISFPPATFFSVYSISIFILAAMNYASSAGSAVLLLTD